ncbi:Trp biosynthesis-associated membrane protein [Microbacterium sp.]|uniref:Trp biosynthesis-associated membrane protein n=1 Tax=Microbacterium sp. TaxID=51671 RepID=UPI00262EE938|nr:Trp biosynthesis-associated membrane protein [Microbacterium sp.]
MTLSRRGRSLAASAFLLAGGIGIISSTQTWLTVVRADAGEPILVPGADAVPLLAPLSLAVLALGAALAIVGIVLRYIFAALALAGAALLTWWTAEILVSTPFSAVAPTVTEATGLAGASAIDEVIATIEASLWPTITLVGWAILLVASVFALVSAHRWRRGGRRFRTDATARATDTGPVDAIDSWDELSRGTDPTR